MVNTFYVPLFLLKKAGKEPLRAGCRWREHVGPRYAWDQVPESRSQVEHHMKKDLLEGLAYPDIDARITAAFEKAETAPWPEAALAL